MLAYYVEWHLKEVWRTSLFAEEDQAAQTTRDPASPAQRSAGAKAKAVRYTCKATTADDAPIFSVTTQPTPLRQRAQSLISGLAV